MNRKLILLSLGLIVGQLATPALALAAESKSLNLITSPLPISLSTGPGSTVSTDIRVKQAGGDNERLKVGLMKFAAFGTEGKPRLLDREVGDDYFDWVKFSQASFDAPNNVWQTIKMTINVPKSAAFGYYYAVVFSRVGDDARNPNGNTNAINGGSAVLVLLDARVANAKRSLELTSLSSEHGVYEFLPAAFKVTMKNSGNVHMIPHGNIFILSGKKEIASLNLNDEQGNVLPHSVRTYPVDWKDGFPAYEPIIEDGKVKLDKDHHQMKRLKWDWGQFPRAFRMGRYTAHLFAVYDDGQRDVPIEAVMSFWVIPWRFLLALLAIVAVVGFGIYSMFRGVWKGARRLGRSVKGQP